MFEPLTEDDKKLADKKKKDREKAWLDTERLANKCLNDKNFIKYKNKYKALEKLVIFQLIDYNDPDPIRFAFNTRRMLDELRQLKLLIENVELDAKPRGKK